MQIPEPFNSPIKVIFFLPFPLPFFHRSVPLLLQPSLLPIFHPQLNISEKLTQFYGQLKDVVIYYIHYANES